MKKQGMLHMVAALVLAGALSLTMVPAAFAASGSWKSSGGSWWYSYSGGGYAKGWEQIDGTWYHFSSSGWMQTGWQKISGKWYYLKASGAMAEGWQKVGGKWYYLTPSNGAMKTGWQKISGSWYYLTPGNGAMKTGWQKISGKWYYLKSSGAMAEGWQKVGGLWYYLTPSNGAMKTGWQWINGEYYYFEPSGAMVANRWIGNYHVGSSGAMDRSCWVGKYYVGADGKWIPNYTEAAKPSDPTRPGAAATPTGKEMFEYAIGDYIVGGGNSTSDVKTGSVDTSAGTYEELPGCGFAVVSSGGFDLSKGYICGHGVYITGYKGASDSSIVIPDTIDGYPVVYANLDNPKMVSADPRLVLTQVDATQAKHLRWLTVGGAPRALYCQGATQLQYLSSTENALLKSFDGSSLVNLEVLDFGTLPAEFSVAKDSLITFSAQYQATDRVVPYIDLSNASYLETFSIARRGEDLTTLGPLTSSGYSLSGCTSLTTVELPFQNITTFNPSQFPYLQKLILTNDPLTASAKSACEAWSQQTAGELVLSM